MRNLKKILALVLALMMVLSVMVTASASFKDDADITHAEAVDVMVAAGILNGDEYGNFRPTEALERSSAAKLIAYLMLGEDIALVDQTNTEFADVKLAHWASGYIAYAAETGLVVGDGSGNYNPNDSINGYSFAKMVLLALCNLGKANVAELDPTATIAPLTGEWKVAPFTGNYALKVRLAIATLEDKGIDLLAGLEDISLNAELTREHAAQMIFNALNGYDILKDTYNLTKAPYAEAGLDGYVWMYTNPVTGKAVEATEPVVTDVYVESFASGTTYADIMKALGVTEKSTVAGVNYYDTDKGNAVVPAEWVKSKDTVPATYSLDVYSTADGKTLKFMYTDEELAVAKLGKEVTDKKSDYYGLYTWTFGAATTYAAKDAYTDKGAYLVVLNAKNELVAEPVLAEIVTGKVMSKGANYVRIGDAKYTFEDTTLIPAALSSKVDYDLYLATDGTVLNCTVHGTAPVVETETLVYVIGYYSVFVPATPAVPAVYNEYGEVVEKEVPAVAAHYDRYVQAVTMDGEVVSYLYRTGDAANAGWYADAGLKAVTVNEKTGVATFTAPAKSDVVAITITEKGIKDTDGTNSYYYNAAEYVEIVGTLSKATVGEGTQKAAAKATNAWAVYTGKGTNKTVTTVYYWTAPAAGTETVDPDLSFDMFAIYNVSADSELITVIEKEKEVEKTVWSHKAIINGEVVVIKTYAKEQPVVGPASYAVDEYGIYTNIAAIKNQASGKVTNLYGTLATFAGFEDYDIADVTVIDVSAKDGNGSVEEGETVTVLYNVDKTTGAKVISVIYITASVKPAN